MKVAKREVTYRFDDRQYHHHVVYLNDDKQKILISPFNLYLKQHASSSIKTSEKYAVTMVRFLNFLLERYTEDGEKFWRSVTETDLRQWQHQQVRERDTAGKRKPSDQTISQNANFIHNVYSWLKKMNFPISMHFNTTEWKFNFKEESLLRHTRSQLAGHSTDHRAISLKEHRTQDGNKNDVVIMSKNDVTRLMSAYRDKVYAACFLLALGTGLREEGVCKMPYSGIGENMHIKPYPEILTEIGTKKTFPYTVVEKGKQRTLDVNVNVWKAICEIYMPLYYKRRKLLERKHPDINPDTVFFINKLGNPVSPKKISQMTTEAKKALSGFPWTFHNARSWFATQFMINHLTRSQIESTYYNAAVEEGLRRQIGHNDIKTTYKYYLRMASIVIATANQQVGHQTFKELADVSEAAVNSLSV